jgi:hypothetical protein
MLTMTIYVQLIVNDVCVEILGVNLSTSSRKKYKLFVIIIKGKVKDMKMDLPKESMNRERKGLRT